MIALVTGASRGIGRATAIALAKRGLDVALWSRDAKQLQWVAEEVAQVGVQASVHACDVSLGNDVDRAYAEVVAKLGTPTIVVNNAGVVLRAAAHETDELDWDRVIAVNLKGTFLVSRICLPHLRAQKQGRIIQVGSISSTVGTACGTAYNASKWGVLGFTKSLAEELRGTGVQTMCVLPGSVDTDMLRGSGYEAQMTADDVARTIVYAALDAPDAMNGSAIEIFGS